MLRFKIFPISNQVYAGQKMKKMALIVDPQIDFINGSLPVPAAEKAMNDLADYMAKKGDEYSVKIITCDNHPWNHSSFKENGGQWPRHCVEHSQGAAIWPKLFEAFFNTTGENVILEKGKEPASEQYSIFQNSAPRKIIDELVAKHDIERIDICGLAGDVCVLQTLKDGIDLYGRKMFNALEEFSPSLDGGTALKNFIGN